MNVKYDVDPQIVVEKIRLFRALNIRSMTDNELFNAILDVLSFNNHTALLVGTRKLLGNTSFYRVRKLEDTSIPSSNFKNLSDMWEPPSEAVTKMGRLNKKHESLLYVSLADPGCAIKECKVNEGEPFALIKYSSTEQININLIGGKPDYNQLNITDKNTILIHDLYNNFLFDEFSRDVGEGTEFLYRPSEMIAKAYFDLPPEVQDAWAYPSIFNKKEQINVCFRPQKAHSLLILKGALICKMENDLIHPMAFVPPVSSSQDLQYYTISEDIMSNIFPELIKK